jgi:hypothetical protein
MQSWAPGVAVTVTVVDCDVMFCAKGTRDGREQEKSDVHCTIPLSVIHYGIPSQVGSAPECTVYASHEDSGLSSSVAAQNSARVALSSLPVCPWIGTLKKPTQTRGGFLECATFLNFRTRLL